MTDRIDPIEPIDPKLRSLLDREAAEPFTTGAMRARILAGVEAAVGGGGSSDPNDQNGPSDPSAGTGGGVTPPSDPTGAAGLLAKPLGSALGMGAMSAIFAAGVAVGTQVVPDAPPPAPAPIERPAPEVEVAPVPPPPPPIVEPPSPAPPPKTAKRRPKPRPRPAPKLTTLAEEDRVIERARTALARGYHDDALAALDDHARRFPAGALAADREGLRALVLSRAGREAEARAAAERYLSDHPQGTLAPAVRTILEEAE